MSSIEPITVTELLDARASASSSEPAYTFLVDGERDERTLTFAELAFRARRVAAAMLEQGEAGGRALLLYQPGLDFLIGFFACLYARVVAVPAYPPYRKAELRRLQAIVADAQPTFVLSTAALIGPIRQGFAQHGAAGRLAWIATDEVAPGADLAPSAIAPGDLAFLQYTSGSTGAPKGVMLTHANLLHNAALVHAAVEHQAGDRYVSWLPTFHDMGFMAGVLEPLYAGVPCVQMAPQAFLQRPVRWLQAISRYRATTSGAPNFAYELCLRKVSDQELAELELSSWTVAFNGAEPVRADTLRRFVARFERAGLRIGTLYPCYGLAEATLMVTGSFKGRPAPVIQLDAEGLKEHRAVPASGEAPTTTLVACGRALGGQELAIVDPASLSACSEQEIGEIWVRGGSVAAGYWQRPEESAATFGARIAGSPRGPFLRTGDLGFVREGQLFIAGRLKDLLILRGRNHYPQDVELTVERSHPALRSGCGAAFSVEDGGEERLVVVIEVKPGREAEGEAIFLAIRRAIAEHHELVPHVLVLIAKGSIHKTSSGKIQRRSCQRAFLRGELEVVASWRAGAGEAEEAAASAAAAAPDAAGQTDSLEERAAPAEIVAWLTAEVARRAGIAAATIDPRQPLTAYGLDSLAAVELSHELQTRFGIEVSAAELFEGLSVRGAARRLAPMAAAPTRALSHGQRALWLLQQLEPTSSAYTIARALRLRSGTDEARLRTAFELLVRRHAALRTRFPLVEGEPHREELPDDPRVFRSISAAGWSEAELARALDEEARAPFDLAEGPVLRVRYFERGDQRPVLHLAVHHIVADFWSLVVLLRELGAIHAAAGLGLAVSPAPAPVGFGDFVAWQDQLLRGDEGERLRAHWRQALFGEHSPLELPADQARSRAGRAPGASWAFSIDVATTAVLRALAARRGATLFGVLLAAWQLFLHRVTGQAQIIVGTPTSGRDRAEVAGVVGYLVNVVPVRAEFGRRQSFGELVERVRTAALEATSHAACPFPVIVEVSGARRDGRTPPLVQVLFAFQKAHGGEDEALTRLALGLPGARLGVGELELESLAAPALDAELDLALSIGEAGDGLLAVLHYRSDLFSPETIASWAECLQVLLRAAATDPDVPVEELPLLSDAALRVLAEFEQGTAQAAESPARPLHEQFEAHVAAAPGHLAVSCGAEQRTRAELDAEANRLAHHLRALGVGPEHRVAICLVRSPRMVAAMLAAWKCGAAYVPIDPEYPGERVRFLVQDTAARVVISERARRAAVEGCGATVVCLDDDARAIADRPAISTGVRVGASWAAYVIYTSGSTGVPKGVVIEHRQAASLVAWAARDLPAQARSRVLAATSTCFDLSIFELWVPACTGGSIVLAEGVLPWWAKAQEGAAPAVTLVNTVPSALAAALELGPVPAGVTTINLAGEVLESSLVDAIFRAAPASTQVYNLYGPSETTTYSSFTAVRPSERVTIGRPLGATALRVLDDRQERVPVGVVGELAIGGPGVARGYGGRPGLTAERFVPDPWGPPGARLYRTGDRVRWRIDGQLEFLGRRDHQVKVRGYRIELSEIASVLGEHPAVLECVAVVRGAGAQARVVGYAVLRAGRTETGEELAAYLRERLPRFMVPSPILVLERLPKTTSGKIDRAALPAPAATASAAERPLDETESGIAAAWAEAMGLARVGANDDLFALGAHSLLVITMRARLQARFGVSLSLEQMFRLPTVAGIAAAIRAAGGAPASSAQTIPRVPRGRRDGGRRLEDAPAPPDGAGDDRTRRSDNGSPHE